MVEALDLGEMTWGELNERLKENPELADLPPIKSFLQKMKDLTRFPAIEGLEKSFAHLFGPMSLTRPSKPFSPHMEDDRPNPIFRAPSPGDVERARTQMTAAAVAREVAPLEAKIAELTLLLAKLSGSLETSRNPTDVSLLGPSADVLVTGGFRPLATPLNISRDQRPNKAMV